MRFVFATAMALFCWDAGACAEDVAQAAQAPLPGFAAIAAAKAKHRASVDVWEQLGVRPALLPTFRVPNGIPLGVTLVVHGYAQSPLAMRALSDHLREHRGQVVVEVLLEGHGYRKPEMAKLGTIDRWQANLDEALALANSMDLPVNGVAFSLGATLLLDAIHRNRHIAFHRVGLVAPLVSISPLFQWLLGGREPDQFLSKHDTQPLSITGYNWALCVGLQRGMEVMQSNQELGANRVRAKHLYVVTTARDKFVSSSSAQTLTVADGGLVAFEHLPKSKNVSHHGLLEQDEGGKVPAVEALRKLGF